MPGATVRTMRRRLAPLPLLVAVLVAAAPADAAFKRCERVVDPYAGTRYEGSDIRRIRAEGVGCDRARRVARRAHRKALGMPPSPSGVRTFMWRGWTVRGDLRGDADRYDAWKGSAHVKWVF